MKSETNKRKSIWMSLNAISPFSKDSDYVEVTEWTNEEGFDISISGDRMIAISRDELELLEILVKALDNNLEITKNHDK